MKRHLPSFFLLLVLFVASLLLLAQSASVRAQDLIGTEPLRVGIYHAPPVAIEGADDWDGIGVHLWRDAAQELGLQYEWRPLDPAQVVDALEDGTVDLVIGRVAGAEEEQVIDFSHSYLVSSIGVAEPAQRSLWEIVGALFSPRFWRITLWLFVAFVIVGVVAWAFERNVNEEQFGQGPIRGIWSGFWWAGVTMSTIGYGDKAPKTVGGRLVALIWMLVAMGITASLTASLTSVLTLGPGLSATNFPGDLRRVTVGSVATSGSAEFLRDERIQFQPFEALQAGLEALQGGELDVFVDDVAALRFVNNESMGGALRINETGVDPQHHAFALPTDSELREPLNRIILSRLEEPSWRSMIERYVPKQ